MVSLLRLKGRALQIDSALIIILAFFTGAVLLVTVNFLPALYKRFLLPFFTFEGEAFSLVADFIFALVFLLLTFGFYFSVSLGAKRYFFMKAQKKRPTAGDIFYYFIPKKFFSSYFYSLRMFFVKVIIFLFCFLPSAVCVITVERFSRQGVSALVCISLVITALCMGINGGYFYSLFYSSFFLCDYYFIEGSYLSFRHLVSCSQRYMKGKNTLLTRLKMSFTGWFLLCIFLLPIPYVWGYYNQSLAVAAAELMKGKED